MQYDWTVVSALMVFGDTSMDSLARESICLVAKHLHYPVRKPEQQDVLCYFVVKGCEMFATLATSFRKACVLPAYHILTL